MSVNADQTAFWNSDAVLKWIDNQEAQDTALSGLLARLLAIAAPAGGERVLDIGCGTGASTLALAAAVGPGGQATGIDISAQFLEVARRRIRDAAVVNAAFELADAQTHDFSPGSDLVFSRFGVMFFDDPVAAFRNMAAALRPGGRVAFVCWSDIRHNPWFRIPRDCAIARVGRPAPPPPRAPGPLAFSDASYVSEVLRGAGLDNVQISEEDIPLSHPGGFDAVAPMLVGSGPAVRIIREQGGGDEDLAAIGPEVRQAFAPYEGPGGISVPGRFNFVTARA